MYFLGQLAKNNKKIFELFKVENDLYRDIGIDMKNLPEGLLNLQKNSFLEENILTYIVTQPIYIITENQIIEEEHDQCKTSVTNKASGEGYDDCMTHYNGKPRNENAETVEKCSLEGGENPLAVFQSPSLEATITTKTPAIDELEESIVIAPGEEKKPISILNDIYCEDGPPTLISNW